MPSSQHNSTPLPSKPHIAWLLEASSVSGGVKVIFELTNRLSQRGYPVSILSLHGKPEWFALHGSIKWLRYGNYVALIEAAVRTIQPDILIATWWKTAYVAADINDAHPCRAMYLIQDIESRYYFDPLTRQAVEDTYKLGLEHFTTSKWVMSQLPDCQYMGIAIGRWKERLGNQERRQRHALALIRPQALKGFRELAEVCRRMQRQNLSLMTYGTYPREISLGALHKHVNAPDERSLMRLFSQAGVFISTSLHEGWSMTPMQAMATGTPVVMFNADGNMEYVVDGDNCLIATDPTDMAGKVERVLSDRDLASKLSRYGLLTSKNYLDWSVPFERLIGILEGGLTEAETPRIMSEAVIA